jgi:CubicO group peptidase (beta-lactamase class C family)
MILAQSGDLDLFAPVSKYLPGFEGQKVVSGNGFAPVKREIRISDLLSQTSGLSYMMAAPGGAMGELDFENSAGTVELANRIGEFPLCFQPGEHWLYGSSADVMGAVVEVASGKRFGLFLEDEVFSPLGMADTGFFVPADKQGRLAKTYAQTPAGLVEDTSAMLGVKSRMDSHSGFESGGAGLASTLDEYSRFAQMLLNNGAYEGRRILSAKAVSFMASNQLGDSALKDFEDSWNNSLTGFGYGNFLRVMIDPGRATSFGSAGEYGWDGALGAYFANSPKDRLSVVFMMQRSASGTIELTRRLRNVIFSAVCG